MFDGHLALNLFVRRWLRLWKHECKQLRRLSRRRSIAGQQQIQFWFVWLCVNNNNNIIPNNNPPTSTTKVLEDSFIGEKWNFCAAAKKSKLSKPKQKQKRQKIENFITTNGRAFRTLAISFVICGAISEIEICNCSHKSLCMFECKIQETQITSTQHIICILGYTK